jgi:two-component system nitrate/nitrite response regulator NarL
MGDLVATILIEPHQLLREALATLIGKHSYRVLQSVGSVAQLESVSLQGAPELVVVGPIPARDAAAEVIGIRRLFPETKIALLPEDASAADQQILLGLPIEGCVPLSVSLDTLLRSLDLIMSQGHRVLVLDTMKYDAAQLTLHDSIAVPGGAMTSVQSDVVSGAAIALARPLLQRCGRADDTGIPASPSARSVLSEREAQIIKMLTRGHSNKVIARRCDLTEATIKVHLKSILRKLHVGNRTQAALWAIEHGYNAPAGSIGN